ncbi:hypothetical protein [Paenibacillus caui]|uniref:hypothetical protein n=1 Tax=Paenibacillus caui TaxID=2873927 RepID=UPI001CA917F8|nr:hypothetical protein [Paenibacillus caui]
MIKKNKTILWVILSGTIFSFILGVVVFNFITKQETAYTEGAIAEKNQRTLINDSSVIVKGTVREILPSKWSNPNFEKGKDVRNIIQTDILVNVENVYKNKPYDDKVITVRIDGGTIGNKTLVSEGFPDFVEGEEVVLFLSEDDGDLANPNENYYVLTGMYQGKFSLKESKSTDKIFSNTKDSYKLSTIHQEINSVLEDLKKNPIPKMTKEEIATQNEKLFGK